MEQKLSNAIAASTIKKRLSAVGSL